MTTEHQSNTVIHIGDAYVRINAYYGRSATRPDPGAIFLYVGFNEDEAEGVELTPALARLIGRHLENAIAVAEGWIKK